MAKVNAADEESLEKQRVSEEEQRKQDLADLENILKSDYGRRFIWRVMEKTKAFGSLWAPNAEIHKNVAQADIGRWLFQECQAADLDSLFTMIREMTGEK